MVKNCGKKDFKPSEGKRATKMRKVKNFEMVRSTWKFKICHVLNVFVCSFRLKHCMKLIQLALDSPGFLDYFSYPHHGPEVRKKSLEPFECKNLPQRWGKSEISRWSNQLENVIFRLPTFFSKVSKIFPIGHIAFIFSLRCVFIVILDPWKIWRAYDKTSRKYLGEA